MKRELETKKKYEQTQVVLTKQCVKKTKFSSARELEFAKPEWIILKSRKNFLNERFKVVLTSIFSNAGSEPKVTPTISLSVDYRDGEIKEVLVLKDNLNLFCSHKEEILAIVEQNLNMDEKVEKELHLI